MEPLVIHEHHYTLGTIRRTADRSSTLSDQVENFKLRALGSVRISQATVMTTATCTCISSVQSDNCHDYCYLYLFFVSNLLLLLGGTILQLHLNNISNWPTIFIIIYFWKERDGLKGG
jgi:hypothetical protein